jgi:NodT family efflux transporter outer membrane factor (OMF) lipoprotein
VALAALVVPMAGCLVGPKYAKPPVETPPAYKELKPADSVGGVNWKPAQPEDAALRGNWWEIFQDPELNQLEEKVSVSNQNLAAAAASYAAARALVGQARSQYFPTLSTAPSITYSRPSPGQLGAFPGAGGSATVITPRPYANYSLPFEAAWEPDLWGRVRNSVRVNAYAAQASFADVVNVRLAAQAELAVDYYELCGQDALKEVFDATVIAYRETLEVAQAQYKAGVGSDEAVASAEAQLKAAEAQDANLGVLRAQYEHAIAVLIGQPASTFSLSAKPWTASPPAIPAGVPAELLERRPDVAAGERGMAQANAQIGVAKSAYFPSVLLSGMAGFGNVSLKTWLTWPSRFWAVGTTVTETIFDAGLRKATVQQYRAAYDQTVATYRQVVLTGFQEVEDNLAAMRILSQTLQKQNEAVQSAKRSFEEATVRYKAGVDPYLNVLIAQTIFLNDQQAAVNFRTQQMVASVQLIKALGGGWNNSRIPAPGDLPREISAGQPR